MGFNKRGHFVISLDLEMYWGMRDICLLSRYQQLYAAERERITELLRLFEEHRIHATWAVVGLLFLNGVEELEAVKPDLQPAYLDPSLSPYPYLEQELPAGGEQKNPELYAPSIIELIRRTPGQRIGTHTFSHYYCLEPGQTAEAFDADLQAAVRAAEARGITLESLVLPRNQLNQDYLKLMKKNGIHVYRGNPSHPLYEKGNSTHDRPWIRMLRLLDSYFNLTGHHTYPLTSALSPDGAPANIPASRFLRSYSPALRFLEPLRIRRILKGMTKAARKGEVFHLWWHPYNMADSEGRNMNYLRRILAHYEQLRESFGMASSSMEELCGLAEGALENGRMVEAGKQPVPAADTGGQLILSGATLHAGSDISGGKTLFVDAKAFKPAARKEGVGIGS